MGKTYHQRGKPVDGYPVMQHPCYRVWVGIKQRCCNSASGSGYDNYGGRGIGYDPSWEHFENFAKDMGIPPDPLMTIDCIDNDKGYCKSNCRWTDRTTQCHNRRRFKNNTTGYEGVTYLVRTGRYSARWDHEHKRYKLGGTFATPEEASVARGTFIGMFFTDRAKALAMLERPSRYDSSTGVRGITRHVDGGFMVRVTDENKTRKYLGYFKEFDDAKKRLDEWKDLQSKSVSLR